MAKQASGVPLFDTLRFAMTGGLPSHVREMYRLVRPQALPEGMAKNRMGNPAGDGGYVMADDFAGISAALSLGIGDEISWDLEMAGRGISIYQFDHTVDAPPAVASQPLLKFFRTGIAGENNHQPNMKTVAAILRDEMGAHSGDLIVKMDIDGYEWGVFQQMDPTVLGRFRQICLEIHQPLARPGNFRHRQRNLAVLRKLHAMFAPVHLHANNAGHIRSLYGLQVPKLLEITYLRRDGRTFSDATEPFPGRFDVPNVNTAPEIPIGDMFSR